MKILHVTNKFKTISGDIYSFRPVGLATVLKRKPELEIGFLYLITVFMNLVISDETNINNSFIQHLRGYII